MLTRLSIFNFVKIVLFSIPCIFFGECDALCRCVTPQKYGAKADGITDDRAAIQAALDNGGNVYFPKGIYQVSNSLHVMNSHTHIKLHKKAIIECDERTIGTKEYGNAGATIIFHSKASILKPMDDVEKIEDVGIKGGTIRNKAPKNQSDRPMNNENAIGFTHCKNFYCRNVKILYCNRKGITAQYYNINGVIENCVVENCGVHGITVESHSDSIEILNNKVVMRNSYRAKGENTSNGRNFAIHIIESQSVIVKDNVLMSDFGTVVYSNDCYDIEIKGNTVISDAERGIVLSSPKESFSKYEIAGNTITSTTASIDLSGQNTGSIFVVENNSCSTTINLEDGVFKVKKNSAFFCKINHPVSATLLIGNVMNYVDVTNASEDTRPLGKENVYKEEYRNWKPREFKDQIKKQDD